jgi:hypothetical protein
MKRLSQSNQFIKDINKDEKTEQGYREVAIRGNETCR